MKCVEQRDAPGHYMRFEMDRFLDAQSFQAIIRSFGGYIDNVLVGRIGDVTIFNGFTWFSVSGTDSFETSEAWARRFHAAILRTGVPERVR